MERFVMNLLDKDICKVEEFARENSCTMSWLYRALLHAVEKKYRNNSKSLNSLRRPRKFDLPFHQITICFYGDKIKWLLLARAWNVELGPLIRFALDLYYKGELEVDLDSVHTIKKVKIMKSGKVNFKKKVFDRNRYIYMFHCEVEVYKQHEFHPKNPNTNIALMEKGLKNRKSPLIC